jgi:HAD superfamily hydrolase (TIGR01549 family)
MIKAVIFDFDGVIVESIDVKTDAFCYIFKDYPQHVPVIRSYQIHNGGISRMEKFKYIYKNILRETLSDEKLKDLCQQFRELVLENVIAAPFVNGAEQLLKDLSRQYPLFIVSGTPEDEMKEIVGRRDLERYFQGVFGSPRKKSEIIQSILNQGQWQPKETVFIGDSINDLDAAKAAGTFFIARSIDEKLEWFKDKDVFTHVNDMIPVAKLINALNNKNAHVAP